MERTSYRREMDRALLDMARRALAIVRERPILAPRAVRLLFRQRAAATRRRRWEGRGVLVPPFLALSVTRACNLRCAGCYARALRPAGGADLSEADWSRLLDEARGMGVSVVTVLGGEPLLRGDLERIVARFPEILFLVFTNGTLLDEARARGLAALENLVPMLSVEGFEAETDERRGAGVHRSVGRAAELLERSGAFFGASITVTRANFATALEPGFVRALYDQGCRFYFYAEYLPAAPGTDGLCLDAAQRRALNGFVAAMREGFPALFAAFPGDEYALGGGCLSAGRGFLHVSADGRFEPCPFSPFSDASARTHTLEEALRSPLFEAIRARPDEGDGAEGCALWERRAWVEELTAGE